MRQTKDKGWFPPNEYCHCYLVFNIVASRVILNSPFILLLIVEDDKCVHTIAHTRTLTHIVLRILHIYINIQRSIGAFNYTYVWWIISHTIATLVSILDKVFSLEIWWKHFISGWPTSIKLMGARRWRNTIRLGNWWASYLNKWVECCER